MKVVNFKKIAFLFLSVVALTSCTKQQFSDLYDPNYLQEQAKEAFPVKDLDPTHTWAMMSTRTASVKVDGVAGAAYTVKIYSENPVFSSTAPLMAKATATGGQTASVTFDAPTALERVFVSREGSDGRYVVVAELSGNQFVGGFGVNIASYVVSRAASIDADMSNIIAEKVKIPTAQRLVELFPGTIPADAVEITAGVDLNNKTPKLRLKGNYIYDFHYWANDNITRELFIEENAKVTIKGNLNTPVVVYLLPGAELILDSSPYSTPLTISIDTNATWNLLTDKILQTSSQIKVYNKGTVNGGNLTMNQNAELYNYGKLEIDQLKVSSGGAGSVLYNDLEGVISSNSLTLGGAGMYFYNIGAVNIKNESSTSNDTGYWVNAGSYTTGSLSLSAHAQFFHNYCKLFVTEKLLVKDGTFNLKEKAYLEAAEAEFSNGLVQLGADAVFYVKNKTVVNSNGDGMLQGFKGLDDSKPALVKLGGQTVKAPDCDKKHMLSFIGNLIYAAEDIFEETTNTGNQPNVYYDKNAEAVDYSEVNLPTPTEEQCAPAWSIGTGGGSTEDDPYLFTYGFEDMTKEVGDYDFNDVVLQVTAPVGGKIQVTLLAAGATKELRVGFKNHSITDVNNPLYDGLMFDGKTVYEVLGVPAGTITNTVTMNGTPATVELEVGGNFSLRAHGDFYIIDASGAKIHIPEFTANFQPGYVPYAMRVPKDWAYPRERISIEEAYPDFVNWAQNAKTSTNWYDNPVADKVFYITR